MFEKCNRVLGDFYFLGLLKWQTWEVPQAFRDQVNMPSALFIRPAITTIYPDDYTDFIYLLVTEP